MDRGYGIWNRIFNTDLWSDPFATVAPVIFLHPLTPPVLGLHTPTVSKSANSAYSCVKFGHLILRKIIIFIATRYQILRQNCTKFILGLGSASDPAGFKGHTSREGRGSEERDGEREGGGRSGGWDGVGKERKGAERKEGENKDIPGFCLHP